jgi:hypothetical protein
MPTTSLRWRVRQSGEKCNNFSTKNVDKYNMNWPDRNGLVSLPLPSGGTMMPTPAPASRGSSELYHPRCIRRLADIEARRFAVEIYEGLLTVSNVRPAQARGEGRLVCPVRKLGVKNARLIVAAVTSGTRLEAQNVFESATVKFVGAAAGILEAVRLGAVAKMEEELFFGRVRRVVAMLGDPQRFSTFRSKRVGDDVIMRVYGIPTAGLGTFRLEKWLGLSLWLNRNNSLVRIETLRVADEDFRPEIY